MKEALKGAEKEQQQQRVKEWYRWAKEAQEGGAKGAHKYTKGPVKWTHKEVVRQGVRTADQGHILEHEAAGWETYGGEARETCSQWSGRTRCSRSS